MNRTFNRTFKGDDTMEKTLKEALNEIDEPDIYSDMLEVEIMSDEPTDIDLKDIEVGEEEWEEELEEMKHG